MLDPQYMHRLAWDDAGTYNVETKTGGANGSIRHCEVLKTQKNSNLGKALQVIEYLKAKYPKLTYADLIQLAGVLAVEVSGGPAIEFVRGRKDSLPSPDEAEFPVANSGLHLSTFHRMGLSDERDIVALTGGLTLGRAFQESLQYEDTESLPPMKFDNSYFVELMKKAPADPEDMALLAEPKFKDYIKLYAQDVKAFFEDYAAAHKKFSELGFKPSSSDYYKKGQCSTISLAQTVSSGHNVNTTIEKVCKRKRQSSLITHLLRFHDKSYYITSTSKPIDVKVWLNSRIFPSKKPYFVGLAAIWEAEAKSLPRVLQVCFNNKVLVYNLHISGECVSPRLLDFLKDKGVRKLATLKFDKRKLKNMKKNEKLGHFIVRKLTAVEDLLQKDCLPKPITMTSLAKSGLDLVEDFELSKNVLESDWESKSGLTDDQVMASAMKAILAFEIGEKNKKALLI